MQWHREDARKESSVGPREFKKGGYGAGMDGGLRGRTRGNRLTLAPVRGSVVTGFTHCGQTLTQHGGHQSFHSR